MSDAAKFGVYGQEWASWVFIRGCPWTTLQGHKKLTKMEPIKNYTFQLGVLGFSLPGEIATKYLNAQPKKQTPPLMLQSWCIYKILYICDYFDNCVKQKSHLGGMGMFDKKGDGTIVTENLAQGRTQAWWGGWSILQSALNACRRCRWQ